MNEKINAIAILSKASKHMADRADTYDRPGGERSMEQTVAAFNIFHGTSLTEAQGWHFMQILKDVRLFSSPENYHADSAEDCAAYAALKGEAIFRHSKSISVQATSASRIDDVNGKVVSHV